MTPEESIPALIDKPKDAITIWTICDRPPEYPGGFILRVQFTVMLPKIGVVDLSPFGSVVSVMEGGVKNACVVLSPLAWHAKTCDELEAILPPGVVRLAPMAGDAAYVVGVWIE